MFRDSGRENPRLPQLFHRGYGTPAVKTADSHQSSMGTMIFCGLIVAIRNIAY